MGSCLGWKTEEQWTKDSLGPLSCKTKSKKETSDGFLSLNNGLSHNIQDKELKELLLKDSMSLPWFCADTVHEHLRCRGCCQWVIKYDSLMLGYR